MKNIKINWFPGHMAKTIKQMEEKLNLVDIVIEVLDSRAVLASMNPVIQNLFKNKPKIILLNKKDLSDLQINQQWMQYFQKNSLTKVILTNLLQDQPKKQIITYINELLKDKISRQKKKGILNWQIKVMIIGIPNVGKSKLINNLVKKSAANVANVPGLTKGMQWIKLTSNINLLDTPGILWPNISDENTALHLSLIAAIKDQVLPLMDISCYAFKFLVKYYPQVFQKHYNITINSNNELSNNLINDYFLLIADHFHIKGDKYEKINKAMEKFYYSLRNGIINNISWERPIL